jgi:hypothetical protein
MAFRGVAFCKFVYQRRQYGNVIGCGASHNEIVHGVHAIADREDWDAALNG